MSATAEQPCLRPSIEGGKKDRAFPRWQAGYPPYETERGASCLQIQTGLTLTTRFGESRLESCTRSLTEPRSRCDPGVWRVHTMGATGGDLRGWLDLGWVGGCMRPSKPGLMGGGLF